MKVDKKAGFWCLWGIAIGTTTTMFFDTMRYIVFERAYGYESIANALSGDLYDAFILSFTLIVGAICGIFGLIGASENDP